MTCTALQQYTCIAITSHTYKMKRLTYILLYWQEDEGCWEVGFQVWILRDWVVGGVRQLSVGWEGAPQKFLESSLFAL